MTSGNLAQITQALQKWAVLVRTGKMSQRELNMVATSKIWERAMRVIELRTLFPHENFDLQVLSGLKARLIHLFVTQMISTEEFEQLDRLDDPTALEQALEAFSAHFNQ